MSEAEKILELLKESESNNNIFNPRGRNIIPWIEKAISELKKPCQRCGKEANK